jgi:excisionase family DNA binding protein
MNEFHSPESNLARQRKLDALFADQPFLSATMRASRLHERADGPGAAVLEPLPEGADEILRRMVEGRAGRVYESPDEDWCFAAAPVTVSEPAPPRRESKPRPVAPESPSIELDASWLTFDVAVELSGEGKVAKVRAAEGAPDVMTAEEAAAYLRVSQATLRSWTRQRSVPHARFGRRTRYRRSALLEWLANCERIA